MEVMVKVDCSEKGQASRQGGMSHGIVGTVRL